jgi:hypothetical protein
LLWVFFGLVSFEFIINKSKRLAGLLTSVLRRVVMSKDKVPLVIKVFCLPTLDRCKT